MNTAVVLRNNNDDNALVILEQIKSKLESVTLVQEAKEIADRAAALMKYAKRAKKGLVVQNHCAVIRLLAERRMGELLDAMDRHRGRPAKGSQLKRLSEMGIDCNQSHRWRRLTKITPDDLVAMRDDCDRMDRALTSEYVMRQMPKNSQLPLPWHPHWLGREYEKEMLTDINRLYRAMAVFLEPPRNKTRRNKKPKALVEAMEFVLRDESYLNEHDWGRLRDAFRHVRMFAERGETGARQQLRRFVNPLDGLLRFIDREYWPAPFQRSA